jgi:hypothetical protein
LDALGAVGANLLGDELGLVVGDALLDLAGDPKFLAGGLRLAVLE